jgi:WD40 repeat protein
MISCCAVSQDKRWIVTSDQGEDSILVVWDSLTGAPVKTIFNPHPAGVIALDISSDSMFVITLGAVDEVRIENSNMMRLAERVTKSSDCTVMNCRTINRM